MRIECYYGFDTCKFESSQNCSLVNVWYYYQKHRKYEKLLADFDWLLRIICEMKGV